jgi:hypothetical protein
VYVLDHRGGDGEHSGPVELGGVTQFGGAE